jgi:hypothetical protein
MHEQSYPSVQSSSWFNNSNTCLCNVSGPACDWWMMTRATYCDVILRTMRALTTPRHAQLLSLSTRGDIFRVHQT